MVALRKALVAAVLLAGPAVAGSLQDPELTDPSNDAEPAATNAFADITAGWVNETDGTLKASIALSSFPPEPPDGELYAIAFQTDPSTCRAPFGSLLYNQSEVEFSAGVINGCNGTLRSMQETTGTEPTREDPTLTVEVPHTLLNRSYRGTVVENFTAITLNFYPFFAYAAGQAVGDAVAGNTSTHDVAVGQGSYTLQQGPPPPSSANATGPGNGTDANRSDPSGPSSPPNGSASSPANGTTAGSDTNGTPVLGPASVVGTLALLAAARHRSRS